jgi:hypothetical protein
MLEINLNGNTIESNWGDQQSGLTLQLYDPNSQTYDSYEDTYFELDYTGQSNPNPYLNIGDGSIKFFEDGTDALILQIDFENAALGFYSLSAGSGFPNEQAVSGEFNISGSTYQFSSGQFNLAFADACYDDPNITANSASFSLSADTNQVSQVPEPSTVAIMVMAGGMVLFTGKTA